jgi:antitoxin (DNA-binding transcriptional repressor) of toxin-antitoxin stability system
MSRNVPIEDAGSHLLELIESLDPGEEITILADGEPIAKLRRQERKSWPCRPGTAKATKHWMAPDFDAPLDDMREYME